MKKGDKASLLEMSLLQAMRSLDNQIAREMQRTPAQQEAHGVQKWEPIGKRVEQVTSTIMAHLGERHADLDSLLVLSQSFAKALNLFIEEVGTEGLGKVRTGYCVAAADSIANDAYRALQALKNERSLT